MFHISGFFDEASYDFSKQLALAAELGCKYICPRMVGRSNIADVTLAAFEGGMLPAMRAKGIAISSIGSPIGKIRWDDDAAYAKQLAQLKTLADMADAAGCRYIRTFSFLVGTEDKERAYPAIRDKVRGFLGAIEGRNITLLHENEKGIYGDVPERALRLYRDMDHPQYKLCYDASNYLQCGVDAWAAYEQTREETAYYHMKDCTDGVEVPLGMGQGRIAQILADLAGRGYDGFVTMEPHTAKYALLRRALYWLPFADRKASRVYREIDRARGLGRSDKVTRRDVFIWQHENLVRLLKECHADYE